MTALMKLGQETWGQRLRRAREHAGLSIYDAEKIVSRVYPASYRTIARLEKLAAAPDDKRAVLAYVAVVAYGFDPADFGLADTPAAAVFDLERLVATLSSQSRCTGIFARQRAWTQPRWAAA